MTNYLLMSGLCLVYYCVIIIYAGITADFAWIWPVMAAGILILGKFCPWMILVFVVIFLGLASVVFRGMFSKPEEDLAYVIILGAQVRKDKPSRALLKRLKKAEQYASICRDTILILSGGRGDGEDITEAECMRRWLTERGIAENRMVLEVRSTNTRENLEFSAQLVPCRHEKTGILSNDFHISRAVMLAEKLGYTCVYGIPAKGDAVMELHYVVRETAALVKEKLRRAI